MVPDAIPGFITLNAVKPKNARETYQISFAVHNIRSVGEGLASTSADIPTTVVALISPDIAYPVTDSHERVMQLIAQAQQS